MTRLRRLAQTLFTIEPVAIEPGAPTQVGLGQIWAAYDAFEAVAVWADAPDRRAIALADAQALAQIHAQAEESAVAVRTLATAFRQGEQAEKARVARARALGQFAAVVAHEISQPITAILLNCSAALNHLSRPGADLAGVRESLLRIERDVERAGATVQRIRSQVTNSPPRYQMLNLNHLVEEALDFMDHELSRASVTVVRGLHIDLPRVVGDRVQIQQVLANLYANALEAMRSTPVADRVLTVGTGLEGCQPFVTVRDTGPGVDPKANGRLFDPLFTTKSGGIGLGLSISRSILEAHGGQLWAMAQAPPGACFCFTLRAAGAHEVDAQLEEMVSCGAHPAARSIGGGLAAKGRRRRVRGALRA